MFVKHEDGDWRELMVTIRDDSYCFIDAKSENVLRAKLGDFLPADAPTGSIREVSFESMDTISHLSRLMRNSKRASLLVIDYGNLYATLRPSFRAIKDHRFTHPLQSVGISDLTFDVVFDDLIRCIGNGFSSSFTTQSEFLLSYGFIQELRLIDATPSSLASTLRSAARLLGQKEMGSVYKVLEFNKL